MLFARKGPSEPTFSLRLSANVDELLAPLGRFDLSFSVGIAYYPEDGDTADALLGAADARMYGQKRQRSPRRLLAALETQGAAEDGKAP